MSSIESASHRPPEKFDNIATNTQNTEINLRNRSIPKPDIKEKSKTTFSSSDETIGHKEYPVSSPASILQLLSLPENASILATAISPFLKTSSSASEKITNLTSTIQSQAELITSLRSQISHLEDENQALRLQLRNLPSTKTEINTTSLSDFPAISSQLSIANSHPQAYSEITTRPKATQPINQLPRAYRGPPLTYRNPEPRGKTLVGKRTDSTIKVAPRSKIYLFVSRLKIETSESDLESYLRESGIRNATCKRLNLEAKDGRIYKSAAFHVSFDATYNYLAHNANTWPEHALVKPWIFTSKKHNKSDTRSSRSSASDTHILNEVNDNENNND